MPELPTAEAPSQEHPTEGYIPNADRIDTSDIHLCNLFIEGAAPPTKWEDTIAAGKKDDVQVEIDKQMSFGSAKVLRDPLGDLSLIHI